jgi:predicted DCC family thiol-disulfide oxidoreductase YuxK
MKPLLIYDGDCGFCRFWVERTLHYTNHAIQCSPYQTAFSRYPQIPLSEFEKAVHFVDVDGRISRGAEAMFRALSYSPHHKKYLWLYENIPGFKLVSEFVYRIVASHRPLFSRLTRFFSK